LDLGDELDLVLGAFEAGIDGEALRQTFVVFDGDLAEVENASGLLDGRPRDERSPPESLDDADARTRPEKSVDFDRPPGS